MFQFKSAWPLKSVLAVSAFLTAFTCASDLYADGGPGSGLKILEKAPQEPVIKQENKPPIDSNLLTHKRKILVKKFRITGNTLLSNSELATVVAPGEGKELTVEDIRTIADLITAKYRDAGYLIANAYVPVQSIIDGTVLIKVVEGKIGDISVTGNKSYSTPFIMRHLSVLKENDTTLQEDTAERQLLLLNDYPSLSVKASLKAGKDPGTTDIIATVDDSFPISGSLMYDNYGVKTTSKNRLVGALNLGNLLFSGDQVMLRGLIGLDTIDLNKLSYGRAEYSVPLGGGGTRIGGYYTNSVYAAGEVLSPLEIDGDAKIAGVYVSYPIIKKRDETLTLQLSGDYASVKNNVLGELDNNDEIRKVSFNASYDLTDRWLGRNFFGFNYSRGLGELFGGTKKEDFKSTSTKDGNTFNKITIDAMRIQKLPGYNQLNARISGQYSPEKLFLAEQFILGGVGTVRGFDPSKIGGDSGFLTTLELLSSPLFPESYILKQKVGNSFKLAFFADYGYVFRNNPDKSTGLKNSDYLLSLGSGIRLFGWNIFSAKLDWAVPYENSKFDIKNSMTNIQAGFSF
ncbi:MAG: ShlB/FhaC/HecB family hemolysin secretion/activation protein [Desulfuromonadaceae bacterium]